MSDRPLDLASAVAHDVIAGTHPFWSTAEASASGGFSGFWNRHQKAGMALGNVSERLGNTTVAPAAPNGSETPLPESLDLTGAVA